MPKSHIDTMQLLYFTISAITDLQVIVNHL